MRRANLAQTIQRAVLILPQYPPQSIKRQNGKRALQQTQSNSKLSRLRALSLQAALKRRAYLYQARGASK